MSLVGQTLGSYRIVGKVGEGGMGAVYQAEDTRLNRMVALKVLPSEMAAEPERLQRFEREAKVVASLNHPNIVTLFSIEEAEGIRFLTMELIEGTTLEELIPEHGMTLREFFKVAIPLSEALGAAHEKGITHRDIKPTNVMVTPEERVKILDFGVAKLQKGPEEEEGSETEKLTRTGSVLGTVIYMAPEQVKGLEPDNRADLFALGVVLYQMATGSRPFKGDTPLEVISAILRDTPERVSEIRAELPEELGRIVERCLEKEVGDRYQDAHELRADLVALRHQVETSELDTVAVTAPLRGAGKGRKPKAPDRRWLPFAGAGLIAALALVAGLIFWPAKEEPAEVAPPAEETKAQVHRNAVALLPLRNLGPSPDEFFASGLTTDTSSRLNAIQGLEVVSYSRVEEEMEEGVSPETIGQRLGAGYILDGTIRWGEETEETRRLRATLRLVRVEDGIQVWSESFDRDLVRPLAIQSEIASLAAQGTAEAILGSVPPDLLARWEEERRIMAEELAELDSGEGQSIFDDALGPEPTPPEEGLGTGDDLATQVAAAPSRPPARQPSDPATRPGAGSSPRTPGTAGSGGAPRNGLLKYELTADKTGGVLRIFAGDSRLVEEPFNQRKGLIGRTKRAFKGGSMTVEGERSLPVSTPGVRMQIELEDGATWERFIPLDFATSDHYKLRIEIDEEGQVEVALLTPRR